MLGVAYVESPSVESGDVDLDVSFPPGVLADVEEIQIVACGTSFYAGR